MEPDRSHRCGDGSTVEEREDDGTTEDKFGSIGYEKKWGFLFTAGDPDVLWFCFSTDKWYRGIKPSERYSHFVQTAMGRIKKEGQRPWPVKECWYGVTDSRAIRPACYNPLTKAFSRNIADIVKYVTLEENSKISRTDKTKTNTGLPVPSGKTGRPKLRIIEEIPMVIPECWRVRDGGVPLISSSIVGRDVTLGASRNYETDKDWKALFGTKNVPCYGNPTWYTVTCIYINEVALNPLVHIVRT